LNRILPAPAQALQPAKSRAAIPFAGAGNPEGAANEYIPGASGDTVPNGLFLSRYRF
jgi:hypothetical protein